MPLSSLRHIAPLVVLIAATSAPTSGAIIYGPQIVSIDLLRTWRDGSDSVLASESVSSGPMPYGPNALATSPTTLFPTGSLAAPGHPPWQIAAQSRSTVHQTGNSQSLRALAHAVSSAEIMTPSVGRGHVSLLVTHRIDFQLTEPTPWNATLATVLSSPIYPNLQIIQNPDSMPTIVATESLPTTDPDMSRESVGALEQGSYRVLMSFPLSFDVPGGVPGFYGGVHSASVTFAIPSPTATVLLTGGAILVLRRRRGASTQPRPATALRS